MRSFKKITFVLGESSVGSAGHQLLDRFLIGYNRGTEFYEPGCEVTAVVGSQDKNLLEGRVRNHGLRTTQKVEEATAGAENGVVVGGPEMISNTINGLPQGARCFVYGTLGTERAKAEELIRLAESKGVTLATGHAAGAAFMLPELEINAEARIRKALAVGFGDFPGGEWDALAGLWKFGGWRSAGKSTPKVQALTGAEVWKAAYAKEWVELFAGAVSRSNTIQGDPVKDGRTQNVVGLKLVEKLATKPRGWIVEANGTRMAIFILTGVLEDLNVALELDSGKTISTQLYRPPPPQLDHFSNLAGEIEDFFRRETVKTDGDFLAHQAAVMEAILRLRNE